MKNKRFAILVSVVTAMLAVLPTGCQTARIDGEYTNVNSDVYSQSNNYVASTYTKSETANASELDSDEEENSDTDSTDTSSIKSTDTEKAESQKAESENTQSKKEESKPTESKKEDTTVTLESVQGKNIEDAKKYFDSKGLKYKVTEQYSDSVEKGKVISQNPSADTKAKKGDEIEIIVSKGSEPKEQPKVEEPKVEENTPAPVNNNMVQVPDFVGKTLDEAVNQINSLGLYYTASYSFDNNVPKGTVISQNPGGNSEVAKGTRITMIVSDGAEPEQVTTYYEYSVTDGGAANNQGGGGTTATYSNGPKYEGFWYSFRPYINIECNDGVNYEINARWTSGAYSGGRWKITATYNPTNDRLEYTNGKYYIYDISASGKESLTLQDGNTSGYLIRYSDNELYWHDSANSQLDSATFKKQ